MKKETYEAQKAFAGEKSRPCFTAAWVMTIQAARST